MKTYIRKCTVEDLYELQEVCTKTFASTYRDLNTPANMKVFLENTFNLKKLEQELNDSLSTFLFIYSKVELDYKSSNRLDLSFLAANKFKLC